MSTDGGGGERVSYTTKELLAEIREGITSIKVTTQQHGERLTALEAKVAEHEEVRRQREPQIDALIRDLDVKSAVGQALEERADRGFTRRQKVILLVYGGAQLLVGVLALGPDLFQ